MSAASTLSETEALRLALDYFTDGVSRETDGPCGTREEPCCSGCSDFVAMLGDSVASWIEEGHEDMSIECIEIMIDAVDSALTASLKRTEPPEVPPIGIGDWVQYADGMAGQPTNYYIYGSTPSGRWLVVFFEGLVYDAIVAKDNATLRRVPEKEVGAKSRAAVYEACGLDKCKHCDEEGMVTLDPYGASVPLNCAYCDGVGYNKKATDNEA